jgi:hypothetical protein
MNFMSEFLVYLQLGFEHIANLKAYDHLLFIITLCAVYHWKDWKKVVVLVTAFTIGHSLTLALSALDIFRLPADLVEVLIPITILITALSNVIFKKAEGRTFSRTVSLNYFFALFFGLIHGMGFANFFRSLMGEAGSIILPLFSFNVGIEFGQIGILVVFFSILLILSKIFRINHKSWSIFFSGAGAGVAVILILQGILV